MNANYFELTDNNIDPAAIIEPGAVIGKGNTIWAWENENCGLQTRLINERWIER